MYVATQDPACYPGTTVLKNIPGIREQSALEAYELVMARQRARDALPSGRFSVTHYRAVHRHLFQDVYSWAGEFRTIRLSKVGSSFCYPENIAREIKALFETIRGKRLLKGLERGSFALEAASFLATLNAIHPFREGNGRTQLAFMVLLADWAGHPFDVSTLQAEAFLAAMIASFKGDEKALVHQILHLTE